MEVLLPMVGTTLGHYRILEQLGSGGMGVVYKAEDTTLSREVALKLLPADALGSTIAAERFLREARAAAALSHPNICTVYETGVHDGQHFISMELLEGETLRAQLAEGALPVRRAIDYAKQIAQAMAAAHDKGITHRDLKPENVFITNDERVKILDFGLAKQVQPAVSANDTQSPTLGTLTNPGVVMGTIDYMAPEQVRGQEIDPRADIFSFGAMLHEMLSGGPPFRRETPTDTMAAILKEDPTELSTSDAKIPAALARLVQHCLEKKPAARFQSASDLAFALESVTGSSTTISGQGMVPAPPKHRWLRLLAFSVLWIGLLAGALLFGVRLARQTAPGEVIFEQKTFDPQFISNARFLPENKSVVFSAALEGNLPELFVIHAGAAAPEPLNQTKTHLLSVSKNGELAVLTDVAYLGHRLYRGTLSVMPLDGAPKPLMTGVREADWSPDGSELAIIRDTGSGDQLEYPSETILYKSVGYLSDLRVSPDGNQVVFFEHPLRWDDRGDVIVVERNSRRAKKVAGPYWAMEGVAWTTDGRKVVFSATNNLNKMQPFLVDASGREKAQQALPTIGHDFIQDISGDGRWLIAHQQASYFVRFRMPDEKSEREITWMDMALGAYLSPTEESLLFEDESPSAGINYAVCYRSFSSPKPIRLGEGMAQGFSPDGRWALALINNPPQLVIYPIGPGKTIRLDRGPIESYQDVGWFPNGRSILFCGNEPGKPSRCYRQDISGGSPKPVTPDGFRNALISPDGRSILASGTEAIGLIISVEDGASRTPQGLTMNDEPIKWAGDNRSVFVYTPNRIPAHIEKVDLQSGQRSLVGGEIAPPDRAGIIQLTITDILQEGAGYAYYLGKYSSTLYTVRFLNQP
jgi:serine/threonine protein kinase/Tol biopolymer transport system component